MVPPFAPFCRAIQRVGRGHSTKAPRLLLPLQEVLQNGSDAGRHTRGAWLQIAARVRVEMVGQPRGQRHDRQRRVDRQRPRDHRAVATNSRLTSWDSPWSSTTERAGSLPIRQLPCMCVVARPTTGSASRRRPRAPGVEKSSAPPGGSSSARWKAALKASPPSRSSSTRGVVVVVDISAARSSAGSRLAASTSGWPHIGPFSSHRLTREPDRVLDGRRLDDEAAGLVGREAPCSGR